MQHIDSIHEIKRRAEAIGLSPAELAELAGVHRATVYRAWANPAQATAKTTRLLGLGLYARERQLIHWLFGIHHPQAEVATHE